MKYLLILGFKTRGVHQQVLSFVDKSFHLLHLSGALGYKKRKLMDGEKGRNQGTEEKRKTEEKSTAF